MVFNNEESCRLLLLKRQTVIIFRLCLLLCLLGGHVLVDTVGESSTDQEDGVETDSEASRVA